MEAMKAWTSGEIKDFRKRLCLTQMDFAEMVGVRRQYVNYLEKGVKKPGKTLKILLSVLEKIESEKEQGKGR